MTRKLSNCLVTGVLCWAFIGPAPAWASVPESEPNDTAATADLLPTGPTGDWGGTATIADGTSDEDWWRIDGAAAGSLVFAYVNDDHAFSYGQPWLVAYANNGSTVVESLLPDRIAGAVVPQNGAVYLRVREQGNNDDLYYAVMQYVAPASDQAPESEPNNTLGQATPISAGVMTGTVSGSDVDYYSFTIDNTATSWTVVIVDNDPDDDGNDTQSVLDLVDGSGNSVAYRADSYVNPSAIAELFQVATTGTYYFKVSTDIWSEDTEYRFVLLVDGKSVAGEHVFEDGFESGSTGRWGATLP